jgi:hypothetical protein
MLHEAVRDEEIKATFRDGVLRVVRSRAPAPSRSAAPVPARSRPGADGYAMNGMIRIATMFVILIIGLIAGPAVSL